MRSNNYRLLLFCSENSIKYSINLDKFCCSCSSAFFSNQLNDHYITNLFEFDVQQNLCKSCRLIKLALETCCYQIKFPIFCFILTPSSKKNLLKAFLIIQFFDFVNINLFSIDLNLITVLFILFSHKK